jgi:hypothetical protein
VGFAQRPRRQSAQEARRPAPARVAQQLEKAVAAANKHAEEAQHAQRATTTREAAARAEPPVADEQLGGELAGGDLDDDVDVDQDGGLPEAA